MTPEEKKEAVSEHYAALGRMGIAKRKKAMGKKGFSEYMKKVSHSRQSVKIKKS